MNHRDTDSETVRDLFPRALRLHPKPIQALGHGQLIFRMRLHLYTKVAFSSVTSMQRVAQQKRGRNGSRFPGICADAKSLRVHRNTLLRVLKGEWKSNTLTARYKLLKGQRLTTAEQMLIAQFNRRAVLRSAKPEIAS
jgi:hypothetical protein